MLRVGRALIGKELKNSQLLYSTKNKSLFLIESYSSTVDDAKLTASHFDLDISSKDFSGTRIEIQNYKLSEFLALALGGAVHAKGDLSGSLQVNKLDTGVLILSGGVLKTNSKGWIKYRPPGNEPPRPTDIPNNPRKILENYLWDFEYETLSATIQSDSQYNALIHLQAFGRNKGYLDGKPLKLSINLEMNLLKLLKSYAITKGFPDRLKERIMKVGR